MFWARRHARKEDVDVSTSAQTMAAQRRPITEWRQPRGERFAGAQAITQPTLVVNAITTFMVPTINSFTLSQKIPNAQLIVYPGFWARFVISVSGTLCEPMADIPRRTLCGHGSLEPTAVGSPQSGGRRMIAYD